MFYVYEHIRPDTNKIFYVGKGSLARINSTKDRNKYWNNIVNKVGSFTSKIVYQCNDEELIFLVEIERIHQLKLVGIKLTNMTNGGEGISGLKHTEEAKEKVRQAALKRIHPKHTEETKEKIRKANTGVVFTEERKRKISEKAKLRKMSDATKEKIKNSRKNYKHSLETIAKMIEIQRAMPKRKCPHCDFIGNAGNLKRLHFDNCKRKVK